MNILRLAWRSVRQRSLSSLLTAFSVALGVALTIAIVALRDSAQSSYHDTARGYDAILGPTHGSPLQIVLNTMFHVGDAGGTIPWQSYEAAKKDPRVKFAVPYAVGDMFRGHHVVGTSTAFFKALQDGQNVPLGEGISGRAFRDGKNFEAVVGSVASAGTGLRVGTRFRVTHGVGIAEHPEEWEVVGVMRPTGTPADRGVFVPIETFYEVGGHKAGADDLRKRRAERAVEKAAQAHDDPDDHAHDEEDDDGKDHDDDDGHEHADDPDDHGHADDDHDDAGHTDDDDDHAHEDDEDHDAHADDDHADHEHGSKEELGLSAVGIRLKSPILRLRYVADIRNDRGPVQAVIPQDQVRELFEIVGSIDTFFELIAWLIVFVAGIGILVSLYNTIQGRRREIAILRALGARPHHIFAVIVLESLLITVLGGILGLIIGHAGVTIAAPVLLQRFGVMVSSGFGPLDLQVLGVLVVLGVLTGLLPAWRGLRTPVAENLHPSE